MSRFISERKKRLVQAAVQLLVRPVGLSLAVMGVVTAVMGLTWLDEPGRVYAAPKAEGDQAPSGIALYQRYCARCHGADGRASATLAKMEEIPDLASPRWQARRSDAEILAATLHGTGAMPAFEHRLVDTQARAVVAYVRTFGPKGAPVKSGATPDIESRRRELQRQWDELDRQLNELSSTSTASKK